MKFSDKLKKLRKENNLTQDELADKLFVTRTAVSKWETDNGYPSMESFKLLAKLFHTTIDELISDEDIENKKHLEDKIARNFYWGVLASFLVALGFAIATWVTDIPYFIIGSFVGVLAYWVFAYFATPRYKRLEAKKDGTFTKHLIIRLVILALLIVIIITTAIQTFQYYILLSISHSQN